MFEGWFRVNGIFVKWYPGDHGYTMLCIEHPNGCNRQKTFVNSQEQLRFRLKDMAKTLPYSEEVIPHIDRLITN